MLEQSVVVQRGWPRSLLWLAVASAASVVGVAALQPREILVSVSPPILPPPMVVVQQAAPLPPVSAPTPPPAPVAQYGTTCVQDVEHLGVPLAKAPRVENLSRLAGATASPDGCVVVGWELRTLHVSWDGGATFATLDAQGEIENVSAASERVAVMHRDGTIGLVDRAGRWISRPKLAAMDGTNEYDRLHVELRGAWLFELRRFGEMIAASGDDGATWRYITPPAQMSFDELALDGTLTALGDVTPPLPNPSPEVVDLRPRTFLYNRFDPSHPGWHRTPDPGAFPAAGGHYEFQTDRSWGCGSSQKLIVRSHGRTTQLLGDIRTEAWDLRTKSNGRVAYVFEGNHTHRVVGDHVTYLGDESEAMELGGVDGAGSAIFYDGDRVLRWSVEGGWRVLYVAP